MKELVKLVVFVPEENADQIRESLGKAGAGKIGEYSHCSFSTSPFRRPCTKKIKKVRYKISGYSKTQRISSCICPVVIVSSLLLSNFGISISAAAFNIGCLFFMTRYL